MRLPRFIPLCRSRRLIQLLVVLNLAAIIVVLLMPWPWWVALLSILVVGLFYRLESRDFPLRGLQLGYWGDLDCVLSDGRRVSARTRGVSVVWSNLVLLHLAGEGVPKHVVLLADSCEQSDDFCLLRVWLRARSQQRLQ